MWENQTSENDSILNVKEIQIIVLNYNPSLFITSGGDGNMVGLRDAKQL